MSESTNNHSEKLADPRMPQPQPNQSYNLRETLPQQEQELWLVLLASQPVLARDWDTPNEDEAWQDL
jgi:hypothetical protein